MRNTSTEWPKDLVEARDLYISNIVNAGLFSPEDILDLVERRFHRKVSRATLYRIAREGLKKKQEVK